MNWKHPENDVWLIQNVRHLGLAFHLQEFWKHYPGDSSELPSFDWLKTRLYWLVECVSPLTFMVIVFQNDVKKLLQLANSSPTVSGNVASRVQMISVSSTQQPSRSILQFVPSIVDLSAEDEDATPLGASSLQQGRGSTEFSTEPSTTLPLSSGTDMGESPSFNAHENTGHVETTMDTLPETDIAGVATSIGWRLGSRPEPETHPSSTSAESVTNLPSNDGIDMEPVGVAESDVMDVEPTVSSNYVTDQPLPGVASLGISQYNPVASLSSSSVSMIRNDEAVSASLPMSMILNNQAVPTSEALVSTAKGRYPLAYCKKRTKCGNGTKCGNAKL